MGKTGICIALCLSLLCACSGGQKEDALQTAMDFRAALLNAASYSFKAEVTADYGERVYEFSMDCVCSGGTTNITVTKPDTISGITAQVTNASGEVTFDGTALDFGTLADGNIVPLAVPAVAADSWTSAYIASAGKEKDALRVHYERGYDDAQLLVDTWFSLKNNLPIYAEVCYNDSCILQMRLSDFQEVA